jgi:hypothetical protein
MSEPLKAFDRLDELTPTDLWSDIEHRRTGPEPEPPVSRSRRITVICVAFAIAAVAIVLPVVAITRARDAQDPNQFGTTGRRGVAESPMGIPIALTYPTDWFAENVVQPASLDPQTDAGTMFGLIISNAREAMPAPSDSHGDDDAGPLPDDPDLPPSFVSVTILATEPYPGNDGPDSSLPLSLHDAEVVPGDGNIRILEAQVAGVPFTITVRGGPLASDSDLALADAIVSSIQPAEGQNANSEHVVVPDLVGLPISEAIEAATNAGLTVETIQILDDSKLGEPGADDVLSQMPFAGTEVERGASISVTVTAMPHPGPSPAVDERRVGVYEAMIRELVDPRADGKVIYVNSKLCSYLGTRGDDLGRCPDLIAPDEQRVLVDRLIDLGPVEFVDAFGVGRVESPVTLLGPIIDSPDGLRVEGGYWCGPLCAGGSMYVVELVGSGSGYEVVGTDDSYGSWIS